MTATLTARRLTSLVRAFVPRSWPARPHLQAIAAKLDAAHGIGAFDELRAAWALWDATGCRPAGCIGELATGLREVVTGGLGPRPMHRSFDEALQ
jgi:hypothetical protein